MDGFKGSDNNESIYMNNNSDTNNDLVSSYMSNDNGIDIRKSAFNVRASNYGNLSIVDKMRGVQSNRLNMDADITLTEMYADKALDTRFGGGQYNVTITDIYQDSDLFNEYHGLNTDGKIKIRENYGIDIDQEKKLISGGFEGMASKNNSNLDTKSKTIENNNMFSNKYDSANKYDSTNSNLENNINQPFKENIESEANQLAKVITNKSIEAAIAAEVLSKKQKNEDDTDELYKPISFRDQDFSFRDKKKVENNEEKEEDSFSQIYKSVFGTQHDYSKNNIGEVGQLASTVTISAINKDNVSKKVKEDEDDYQVISFRNMKTFRDKKKIISKIKVESSFENEHKNNNNLNDQINYKEELMKELSLLSISDIYDNSDKIITKYLKVGLDKDEIDHIKKRELIKKSMLKNI